MALKPYSELVRLDVLPHCDTRKAKDDNGKMVDIPYLNWGKCKSLLHENGAESVYFTPIKNDKGSYVFAHYEVANKDGRKTGCYFVSVEIHIDDKTFVMDMPLLNGTLVIYEDTLNQLRIANCHARAFVKGVAIHTGLGFSLWSDDMDTDKAVDDLSTHDITAIKTRVEQLLTIKMQNGGMNQRELCDTIGLSEKKLQIIMASFGDIRVLEDRLKRL